MKKLVLSTIRPSTMKRAKSISWVTPSKVEALQKTLVSAMVSQKSGFLIMAPVRSSGAPFLKTLAISTLTVCGIDELPAQRARGVTHVLSVFDSDRSDIDTLQSHGQLHRTSLRFHDIIDSQESKILPTPEHVAAILRFGSEPVSSSTDREDGHLLVHCHLGYRARPRQCSHCWHRFTQTATRISFSHV